MQARDLYTHCVTSHVPAVYTLVLLSTCVYTYVVERVGELTFEGQCP